MMYKLYKRGGTTPITEDKDFDAVMSLMAHIAKKSGGTAKWYPPIGDGQNLIGLRTTDGGDNHYYYIWKENN